MGVQQRLNKIICRYCTALLVHVVFGVYIIYIAYLAVLFELAH